MFRAYIALHSKVPQVWNLTEGDDSGGGHWSHGVEVTLRGKLNWTREEINEEPLSKALVDYFKYAETQGSVRFVSDEEIELGERNARAMEVSLLKGSRN